MTEDDKAKMQLLQELVDVHRVVTKLKLLETESKQKDETMRKTAEEYRQLSERIENLKAAIWNRERPEEEPPKEERKCREMILNNVEGIFQSTPDGSFLSVNPTLATMLGFDSPEELITASTDRPGEYYLNRDEQIRLRSLLEEHGLVRGFETQVRRQNEEPIWASISVRAARDEGGTIVCHEGIIQDITARKRAEAEIKRLAGRSRTVLDGLVKMISVTLEIRDPYKAGHGPRVSRLATALAEEMGLSQDRVEGISLVAAIHDIGTLYVPAEILCKPGSLTEAEFALVKQHPKAGWEILEGIEFPWPVAEIVLQHHERVDGSGYPAGLSGDAILQEARILAVADVVEAMSTARSYLPALGMDSALEEIVQNKGLLYDSATADACLTLFREKGFGWE